MHYVTALLLLGGTLLAADAGGASPAAGDKTVVGLCDQGCPMAYALINFDADKDGKLSNKELDASLADKATQKRLAAIGMKKAEAKDIIAMFDADKDGVITIAEYKGKTKGAATR